MLRGPTLISMCWWVGETGIGTGPSVELAIIRSFAPELIATFRLNIERRL